jgi:hypothetical protein
MRNDILRMLLRHYHRSRLCKDRLAVLNSFLYFFVLNILYIRLMILHCNFNKSSGIECMLHCLDQRIPRHRCIIQHLKFYYRKSCNSNNQTMLVLSTIYMNNDKLYRYFANHCNNPNCTGTVQMINSDCHYHCN